MSSQEDRELESLILEEMKKELKKVEKDIESTLKKNTIKLQRNSYSPKIYKRTNDMLNNVNTHENGDGTESITTWDNLNYESVTGQDVSDKVIGWVNDGFGEQNGKFDFFNNRPRTAFIEQSISEINKKYGDTVCERVDW